MNNFEDFIHADDSDRITHQGYTYIVCLTLLCIFLTVKHYIILYSKMLHYSLL